MTLELDVSEVSMSSGQSQDVPTEVSHKRVRAYLRGGLVADTRRPVLVWEHQHYPTYYLPAEDVLARLEPTGATRRSGRLGDGTVYDVRAGEAVAEAAAIGYPESPVPELRGLVRIAWEAMDHWFEEDEPVYVHPRDPHKRVDVLASSRHVVVRIGDVVVADSHRPHILFETGLPPRYYLPITDVRIDLLRPSDHRTQCPYKGTASYWDVVIGDTEHAGIVWSYPVPLPESQKIAGLACFYDERVDITVDGEPQQRPRTPFSPAS
ncbi:protein of unknown function DUF427 [Saccharopolyspora erythraea NRRL 2338]|uniref:DUF427 domain-containing protein n=2 Tax=Saccharopolyspora erythraea TaxID=1836 RepID=A4FB19_SACEN|nr:hypothetical protein N599_03635 [Saccharopolyspora erythraea D]QRK91715.1 DUF427 domain-containing protein [Saccharopolyspora erythraea]CAM01244.1 protein of unknown function DUF427 [Saccharopolyspora erythraea NRRL 2338]